jgi:hypothetical protein
MYPSAAISLFQRPCARLSLSGMPAHVQFDDSSRSRLWVPMSSLAIPSCSPQSFKVFRKCWYCVCDEKSGSWLLLSISNSIGISVSGRYGSCVRLVSLGFRLPLWLVWNLQIEVWGGFAGFLWYWSGCLVCCSLFPLGALPHSWSWTWGCLWLCWAGSWGGIPCLFVSFPWA